MDIQTLHQRAIEIRARYDQKNIDATGSAWTRQELAQGFVGDVGDLIKIVMAKEGRREMENVDTKLRHELADCLWPILVLAEKYDVDLEAAFLETMDSLERKLQA